ncbi:sugar phosphate isomerase/epimerase [Blastopirellula sp. J2-11]|uniref:sugar phosphate isomerase/epimerase family protein n=1 Tax=Blastopirellula sp. J2-11 TaxID=2943192 RepID=UPI0021C58814|nr:sugar phosphate isomerase/epimerase family protein [Blastopirellula sp. J2-11]UUO04521.1 sugar phosphate isomerase/epimerase [Blastopirellula sp. J2-11]
MNKITRRNFLENATLTCIGTGLTACLADKLVAAEEKVAFQISLAQWSLHRGFYGGTLNNLDFAKMASEDFGITAVEYVNRFFQDKVTDYKYLKEMKMRAEDHGVRSLLIMCGGEGTLGAAAKKERESAVANHLRWVEAAKFLNCHSIRVYADAEGSADEQRDRAAEGIRMLCEAAAKQEINILVENHGGLSSDGAWLASLIRQIDLPNCGTLPDFGNFNITPEQTYDRYRGIQELMPYAKGVSAKSYNFNDNGEETSIDYPRMMDIVLSSGYHGYVGIEYEGPVLSEYDGIRKSKALLERICAAASSQK